MRQNHRSASPFEARIGFSRAVRHGRRISVAGTAPIGPDGATVTGDAHAQARAPSGTYLGHPHFEGFEVIL